MNIKTLNCAIRKTRCRIHTWCDILRRLTCLLSILLSYLLTPWSRVLLQNVTSSKIVKKFPAFYGTWRVITTFTSTCHLSLSWARSSQSMPPHPTSWKSIL